MQMIAIVMLALTSSTVFVSLDSTESQSHVLDQIILIVYVQSNYIPPGPGSCRPYLTTSRSFSALVVQAGFISLFHLSYFLSLHFIRYFLGTTPNTN